MKKLLIVTLEYPPQLGGLATYVSTLADALPPEKVTVLAPPYRDASAWDAGKAYRIIRKKLLYPVWIWPRWLKMFFAVARIVLDEKIERMLIHHALPAGYVALVCRRFWGVPYLVFYHGTDLQTAIQSPWKRRLLRSVARGADMNIFDSQFLLQKFLQAFPDFSNQSVVIPPGLEPFFFSEPPNETVEDLRDRFALRGRRVVLSVGRLAEGKGFPHLVRLFAKVSAQVPDALLLIAGDGPKRDIIAERILQSGLQNVIRLVGRIEREELPSLYRLADVFALLTHANEGKEEGFGLVFAEAGAMGVPVVAGRCGGVEEVVAHEETGLIVNTYMDDEVVGAIVRLLTDPETAKRFGERGRERAREAFRIDEVVRRLNPWIE